MLMIIIFLEVFRFVFRNMLEKSFLFCFFKRILLFVLKSMLVVGVHLKIYLDN